MILIVLCVHLRKSVAHMVGGSPAFLQWAVFGKLLAALHKQEVVGEVGFLVAVGWDPRRLVVEVILLGPTTSIFAASQAIPLTSHDVTPHRTNLTHIATARTPFLILMVPSCLVICTFAKGCINRLVWHGRACSPSKVNSNAAPLVW